MAGFALYSIEKVIDCRDTKRVADSCARKNSPKGLRSCCYNKNISPLGSPLFPLRLLKNLLSTTGESPGFSAEYVRLTYLLWANSLIVENKQSAITEVQFANLSPSFFPVKLQNELGRRRMQVSGKGHEEKRVALRIRCSVNSGEGSRDKGAAPEIKHDLPTGKAGPEKGRL